MAYQVIARKWRPQTFAEVVGQQHVTRTLQNALRSNRLAHAYVFSGVRGVGKTSTARILAKALNCERGPAAEPCNACNRCLEITAGNSLDVMEIDAASSRGIDQIRELREMVRYAPATGRYRVVILDEAHQLTEEAFNALLKTLEEPPERVIFILATTAPEDLPDTIRSRTQHFHFRSLSFNETAEVIERVAREEGLAIESSAVAVLARAAEGSLRDGLSLLEQAIAYCGESIRDAEVRELLGVVSEEALDELMDAAASGSAQSALGLVHRIISTGENLDSFCREALRHVRNLLVVRVAGADSPLVTASADERPRLERQAARFSEEDLTRFFQILLTAQGDLRHNPDPQIHMEMALLRMVNAPRLSPFEDLLAELRGEASEPGKTGSAAPPRVGGGLDARGAAGEGKDRGRDASATAPAAEAAERVANRSLARESAGMKSVSVAPQAMTQERDRAPATHPGSAAVASPPEAREHAGETAGDGAGVETAGIEPSQIKMLEDAAAQQRFLASLLGHVTRWELSGAELRVFFPPEQRSLADLLQAREPMERLRSIANQVLGQQVRVCVRLGASRALTPSAAASATNSGSETEGGKAMGSESVQNPAVRSVLERFGGRVSGVKPAGGS